MTEYEQALDSGLAAIEQARPQTVKLSIAPDVDVRANVGDFRRQRALEGTGYEWMEFGTVVLRREALRIAGVTDEPDSGQELTVYGRTYRIKFCKPDVVSYALDCVTVY